MKTQLILVDGIFGSGKSTTTKLISDYLLNKNIPNKYFEEEEQGNPLYLDYCEEVTGNAETKTSFWRYILILEK